MGEVYRARDAKLSRDVAIKILPETFATDPDRLARFEREARTLAALNHPNIAQIYGLDGSALIMELVQGEDLADRVARGPIPIDEALPIAKQIAEALEAAHEQGIIHRDLKPANIKVRPDGTVKVLDFGLAKALTLDPSAARLHDSPTVTSPAMMTGAGIILGTAAYMSPEQARGRVVEKRADIWAFGCVLYEMLTGTRAFGGGETSDTIANVLTREPDWSALPPALPASVRTLLRRCLTKEPKRRLDSAAAARLEIEDVLSGTAEEVARSPAPVTTRVTLGAMAFVVSGFILLYTLAGVWRSPLSPPGLAHMMMPVLPADQLVGSVGSARPSRTAMAMSPDGRLIVFSATRGTVTQLYVRGLDQSTATPIAGTEGAMGPFFSPDGRWIGFWADHKIKKVAATGGPPATIADAPAAPGGARGVFGASWGDDGTIFFADFGAMVSQVSSAGGPATAVTMPDLGKGERHLLPHALPGGTAILFTTVTATEWEMANVVLRILDTGEQRVLIHGATDARYVATGHLVYMKTGTLTAVPFDLPSRQLTGDPVALIQGVMHALNAPNASDETGAAQFSVSESGTLLYAVGGVTSSQVSTLVWTDRTGAAQPLAPPPRDYRSPRLSPDGDRVAVWTRNEGPNRSTDVWVYHVLHGSPVRLTNRGENSYPIWSPDSARLIYASNSNGTLNLYAVNADGSGTPERLTTSEYAQRPSTWVATGQMVAFLELHAALNQIWILPMEGDRQPRLFLESRFNLRYPEFSPDGHWLAYVSNESGSYEVYVQPYPGLGEKHRISVNGGQEPIWTANGRELLYREIGVDNQRFLSVAISSLVPFRVSSPHVLFEARRSDYGSTTPNRGWDVSSDGKRFLLSRPSQPTDRPVTEMHVVLNWTEELKRLVLVN
jgi:Tol biopolymer transport system component